MSSNWRYIAEGIAAVAVVVSLLFVGFELQLSRSAAETEALGGSSEMETAFRTFVAEHADIWHKGCIDDTLTNVEEMIFSQVLLSYQHMSFMKWLRSQSGVTGSPPEAHVIPIALSMHQFPGFKKRWDSHVEARTEKLWAGGITDVPPGDFYSEVNRHFESYTVSGERVRLDPTHCGLTS